ncbi:DUF2000 family protein [Rhizobium sp. YIM 134829]|uniref:DUF2000 family protein n=1 Tax=Rhizobium sp. YIM 134829 TaxID=3390453 RepID=UPI00397E2796
MFDTKIAIVLREDLAMWQKLNVTGFLVSGLAATHPEIIGEAYRDAAGHVYSPMSIQPMVVLAADQALLRTIQTRLIDRALTAAAYIEEMFSTGHDADNRAVFAQFSPETAKLVGLGLRAERKIVDKIMKGARMHP